MKLENSKNRIIELMSRFVVQIEGGASMGKTDLNKTAETILIPLLNEVYGWNLENINYAENNNNYPGIDLGDEVAGISIQVTATPNLDKVKHTLEQFIKYSQYSKYNRLIIYILKKKQDSYSQTTIQKIIQNRFDFDPQRDIWDYQDILKEVSNFQIDKALRVQEILEANFGGDKQSFDQASLRFSRGVLDTLNHLPNLPSRLLERSTDLDTLKNLVLSGSNQSVGITGTALKVGVHGMGGIGKSVLAAMLARDKEVQAAFPDGVFWITLGQKPTLTLRQLDLARMLGDSSLTLQDVQQGKVHLSNLLNNRTCLLILDDVWKVEDAAAFSVLGQQSKLLLTTRDSSIVKALDAVEHQVELLSDEEALELLAVCSGQCKETLPIEAHEIVKECGNLPLALSMIGSIAKARPNRWDNLLYKLKNADLDKIRHQFPDYPYPDLLKAMQVSVDALEPEVRTRYFDFAVFQEDVAVSEATLQTFWEPEGLDEYDTQDVIDVLVERSLARRDEASNLSLHDLQYDYVKKQVTDLPSLHNKLLEAYATQCPQGWHTYPKNDGYFFEHLAYHLKEARRNEELFALARNSEFSNAQREFLPNEPGLPLKTIQTALHCAADTDNAVVMAEFLLKYARQLANVTTQGSPLEALRVGSLSKGLSLVKLYEPQPELYILWNLLLVWELKEINQREEANEILKQLLVKRLPRFDRTGIALWRCNVAAHLLAYVFEVNPEVCTELGQHILDGNDFSSMCMLLCERGYCTEAFDIMRLRIENKLINNSFDSLFEIDQLQRIAEIQAKKFGKGIVLESLSKIADLLLTPRWELNFASQWASLASLQVCLGEEKLGKTYFDKAIDIAKRIQHQERKAQDFLSIIYYQKKAGKTNSSFLEDALELMQSKDLQAIDTSDLYSRVKFSVEIAKIQALLSRQRDVQEAQETLERAQSFAEQIEDFAERMECFIDIGKAYVDIGELDDAFKIAEEKLKNHFSHKQLSILLHIVQEQLEIDDIDSSHLDLARKATNLIENQWEKDRALTSIALAQAKQLDFDDAHKTVNRIKENSQRDLALTSITRIQIQAWLQDKVKEQDIHATIQKIDSHIERIQTWLALAEQQLGRNDLSAAERTTSRIKDQNYQSSIAKLFAIAHAKANNFDEAVKITNQISDPRIREETKASIAFIQIESGRPEAARSTLASMFTIKQVPELQTLKTSILIEIADIQLKTEANLEALTTVHFATQCVESIRDRFAQAQLLANLAEQWGKLGRVQESQNALHQAFRIAETIRAEQERRGSWSLKRECSQIFASVAETQARIGNFDAALEIFEMIIHDALLQANVLRVIAQEQSDSGTEPSRWDELKETVAAVYENVQADPLFSVMCDLVQVFCTLAVTEPITGEQQAALETLRDLREQAEERDKSKILANIAISEIQILGTDAALETLNSIDDPEWCIRVLWSVANTQFKNGSKQELLSTLDAAREAYDKLRDEKKRLSAIRKIVGMQAMAGLSHQATRLAEQILENREPLLSMLAQIFADAGDLQSLKQFLIPCASYLNAAYEMCSYLAKLYPEQSAAIAGIVGKFN